MSVSGVEYSAVLAGVRAVMLEEGAAEPWRVINYDQDLLKLDFSPGSQDTVEAHDRFKGQVRRALGVDSRVELEPDELDRLTDLAERSVVRPS